MLKKKGTTQKEAIIQTALTLFITKGYDHTSVDEIIAEKKIAKGTFYYYFKSKEELLFAVISQIIDEGLIQAKAVANQPNIPAPQKLVMILAAVNQNQSQEQSMMNELHKTENTRMHQEIAIATIKKLSPIMADVIRQGISEGVFFTPYPQECIEMFLSISQFLLDESLFGWDSEKQRKHIEALLYLMQTSLHASDEAMSPIYSSIGIKV